MTSVKQARHSRFQQGSAVFTCRICKRRARDTGENGDLVLCTECYGLAGRENTLEDYGIEDFRASHRDECKELFARLQSYGINPQPLYAELWDATFAI